MGNEILEELRTLDERVIGDHDSVVVPGTYTNIIERIIAGWAPKDTPESIFLESIAGRSFFVRYLKLFKSNVLMDFDISDMIFLGGLMLFVSMILAFFPTLAILVAFSTPFWLTLLCSGLSIFLLFAFGGPLLASIDTKGRLEREKLKEQEKFEREVEKLRSDPVFLLTEVQENLNAELKEYRKRLTELQAKFKAAIQEPRVELEKKLAQFKADEENLLEIPEEDLPEREFFLVKIRARIVECSKLLEEASPQEIKIAETLKSVEGHIDALQAGVTDLTARKSRYEERTALLSRVRGYDSLKDERFDSVLESARQRELLEIESNLRELDREVVLTHVGLEQVNTSLPPLDDCYKLSAEPPKLLSV